MFRRVSASRFHALVKALTGVCNKLKGENDQTWYKVAMRQKVKREDRLTNSKKLAISLISFSRRRCAQTEVRSAQYFEHTSLPRARHAREAASPTAWTATARGMTRCSWDSFVN